jgi:hypothetical protein
MSGSSVLNIAFAGGSCGITMVRVGERLSDLCQSEDLKVNIKYVDLWISDYLLPNTDLVVEMFPYYKDLDIPVINGRPFLNPLEENEMYGTVIDYIKDLTTK